MSFISDKCVVGVGTSHFDPKGLDLPLMCCLQE